jgi:hypothetical protein
MFNGHTQSERGKRVVCWSSFPCRVYIGSNRHDSQIRVMACSWPPSSSIFSRLMINVDY